MTNRFERAELLAAMWVLGGDGEKMPTSHGILDRALAEERDALPQVLSEGLTFSITDVGLRCMELPDILLAAQEAMLTSEPNYTYLSTVVTLDRDEARQVALANGLSTAQAAAIGHGLQGAAARLKAAMRDEIEPVAA